MKKGNKVIGALLAGIMLFGISFPQSVYATSPSPPKENDVTVAVIDTGTGTEDEHGHGSLMSEIIEKNTPENVVIKSYKAFDSKGESTVGKVYKAILEAVNDDVDVINLSISSKGSSKMLESAMQTATEAGIAVIVAAGNEGEDVSDYMPGNLEGVICVGSAKEDGSLENYSNYGTGIDVTTSGTYTRVIDTGDVYEEKELKGTSISCAYITSYAVTILTKNENADVEACLMNSVNENGYLTKDNLITTIDKKVSLQKESERYTSFTTEDKKQVLKIADNSAYFKTKTCRFRDVGPCSVGVMAYKDATGEGSTVWNKGGSIIWGMEGTDLILKMTNVNVNYWTPYLTIVANPRPNVYPSGWTDVVLGSTGVGGYIIKRPGGGDSWNSNSCRIYIGAQFATDSVRCVWSPYRYTLTFHSNGGNDIYYPDYNVIEDTGAGNKVRVQIGSTAYSNGRGGPSRGGYSFQGWYDSNGVQVYDRNGDCVNGTGYWNGNTFCHYGDVDLYAHWSADRYTITFDSNGGPTIYYPDYAAIEDTGAGNKVRVQIDANYYNNGRSGPNRPGYTFTGWYDGNGTIAYDNNGNGVDNGAYWYNGVYCHYGNVTLFAHWVQNTYTLTFNPNGGTCSPGSKTALYDTVWGTLATASRSGYRFDGWYTALSGGSQISASTICKGNQTVYAHWSDITPPSGTISATPTTWKSENGVVTIKTSDAGSGIGSVVLYRKTVTGSYEKVNTWNESSYVTSKTYTYTETSENCYQYKVEITDKTGNKITKESNYIYIDKSAPNATETVIETPGELDNPVTTQRNEEGQYNSESYGLYIKVNATDVKGDTEVSNIRKAYVKVYDTENPGTVRYYDVNEDSSNKIKSNRTGKDLDVLTPLTSVDAVSTVNVDVLEKPVLIDITRDFHKILNLSYEVHIIDGAGNDSFSSYTNLRGSHQRETRMYATVERLTEDSNLSDTTAFQAGYKGVVHITTTGWVNRVSMKWPEEILAASAKDATEGITTMNYDSLVDLDPSSNPTIDLNGLTLDSNNTVAALDTHDTTFTRRYDFYFWVPIYQNFTDENQAHPFMNDSGLYVIGLEAQRDYSGVQVDNGIAEREVIFSLGEDNILKTVRSSLVY